MDGQLFSSIHQRPRKRRKQIRRRRIIFGALILLVAGVSLVLAWPRFFGNRDAEPGDAGAADDSGGAMVSGNPAHVETPQGEAYGLPNVTANDDDDPEAPEQDDPADVAVEDRTDAPVAGSGPGEDRSGDATEAGAPPPNGAGMPQLEPFEGGAGKVESPEVRPPPVTDNREPSPEAATLMAEAERAARSGEALRARDLYRKALKAEPNTSQRDAILAAATDLAERTILGPRVEEGDPLVEVYVVQSGDMLSTIARRYDIPYALIMRINRLSTDRITIGQHLKVIKGPMRVRIQKSRFRLELWLGDVPVRVFPVAIGTGDRTPVGEFKVTDKVAKPTFYPPESLRGTMPVIKGDDPENPLGTRWLRFGQRHMSLGIHGTNEPQSIGKQVSLGCVRLLNDDVEFLYDCLVIGSDVAIVP